MGTTRRYTDADIARAIGVTPATVGNWRRRGLIPGVRKMPSGVTWWSEGLAKAVVAEVTGSPGAEAEALLAQAAARGRPARGLVNDATLAALEAPLDADGDGEA